MTEIIIAVVGGLLGGSAVAALINQIGEGVRQKRKLKADAESGESKYHEVLSRAAISAHETHGAILMDSECQPLEHKVYGRYEVPTEGGETT